MKPIYPAEAVFNPFTLSLFNQNWDTWGQAVPCCELLKARGLQALCMSHNNSSSGCFFLKGLVRCQNTTEVSGKCSDRVIHKRAFCVVLPTRGPLFKGP